MMQTSYLAELLTKCRACPCLIYKQYKGDKMIDLLKDLQKQIDGASNYMAKEIRYSSKTISNYKCAWRKIKVFVFENKLSKYDREAEKRFLAENLKSNLEEGFTYQDRLCYNGSKMLIDYIETGVINMPSKHRNPPREFNGLIGGLIVEFLTYYREIKKRQFATIIQYERSLHEFSEYCHKLKIVALEQINEGFILKYIKEWGEISSSGANAKLSGLRVFIRYLYVKGLIDRDLSKKVPRYRRVVQPKLPSVYSKDEVEQLIGSIDRSTPTGKRSYAVIILAARLGIRASDIANLKFENICWKTNRIILHQYKTGRDLVLPLLPDVGNAIIEYLKSGRPQSEDEYVFLSLRPPYGKFSSVSTVTSIVQNAFRRAGISTKGRRFGAHSLRHSLSSRMLENKTALPVISEVLGHKNFESTRYYLRIDFKSMQQCALEVSSVSQKFYYQKGGCFYE